MFEPKMISSSSRFQKITIATIAILTLLFISPFIYMYGSIALEPIKERYNRTSFDSAKWQDKALIKSENPIRIRMIDDLLKRYSFQGMSREEVANILGEPDKTAFFKEWDMVYWLGPERGFISVDSEWLVLRLNEKKEVSEYRIARD
ncbi:MAG: hypothetical protein WBV94_17080 [Blastocatellia bacterium]